MTSMPAPALDASFSSILDYRDIYPKWHDRSSYPSQTRISDFLVQDMLSITKCSLTTWDIVSVVLVHVTISPGR